MIQNLIFNVIGGLGMFLLGMKLMSEALQIIAGDRLRRIIGAATDNRILGVGTGLLVTMIVQSSSVTTVMVVSFVNAGLMTLMQAASVILGANIGTTITGWILVLRLDKPALPILGVGVFLHLFGKRESVKFFGQCLMGFGMIFFGLNLLKAGFAPMKDEPQFVELLSRFGAQGIPNIIMSVAVGAALTMIVQSSSVMLGVTIALATVGLIDFRAAVALVLGENIGTTITAQLAALNATTTGRRAAMFHSMVNVFGVSLMILLFPFWVHIVDKLMVGDPNFINAAGERPYITAHIAFAHTSFNVLMVLIVIPILRPLVNATRYVVSDRDGRKTSLQFLHAGLIDAPALAIEQGRFEVFEMAKIARNVLHLTRELYQDMTRVRPDLKDRILQGEKTTDVLQNEITVFMARVMSESLSVSQSREIQTLIRLADEIESVADYCERLANTRSRLILDGEHLCESAQEDARRYLDETITFYENVVERAQREEPGWLPEIRKEMTRLAEMANGIRDTHLQRIAQQECTATTGIFFSDMIVAMRRIRNHSYNMAEAFLGQKMTRFVSAPMETGSASSKA